MVSLQSVKKVKIGFAFFIFVETDCMMGGVGNCNWKAKNISWFVIKIMIVTWVADATAHNVAIKAAFIFNNNEENKFLPTSISLDTWLMDLECQFNRNILLTLRFPKIIIYVSWFVNEDYRIGVVIATNVNAQLIWKNGSRK